MTDLVMKHEITKSYVAFKAIYVPVEYLSNFPDVDVPFEIIADNKRYEASLDSYHRIKLTEWFNSRDISEGDTIELHKEGRMKYALNLKRQSGLRTRADRTSMPAKSIVTRRHSSAMSKRQVEIAAIDYVKRWLNKKGIKVRDADGEGCDLITETNDVHYLEVKGTSYSKSPIMIYESIFEFLEKEGIDQAKYFIYIVSDIATTPQLRIITPEMQKWQAKNIRVLENKSFDKAYPISLSEFKVDVEKAIA